MMMNLKALRTRAEQMAGEIPCRVHLHAFDNRRTWLDDMRGKVGAELMTPYLTLGSEHLSWDVDGLRLEFHTGESNAYLVTYELDAVDVALVMAAPEQREHTIRARKVAGPRPPGGAVARLDEPNGGRFYARTFWFNVVLPGGMRPAQVDAAVEALLEWETEWGDIAYRSLPAVWRAAGAETMPEYREKLVARLRRRLSTTERVDAGYGDVPGDKLRDVFQALDAAGIAYAHDWVSKP